MIFWPILIIAYVVGGVYTYKKERWEYKQEMIHYQGDRPDTLEFIKHKYPYTNEKSDTTITPKDSTLWS